MWRGRERLEAIGPEGMIDSGMVIAGNPDHCYEVCERYVKLYISQF